MSSQIDRHRVRVFGIPVESEVPLTALADDGGGEPTRVRVVGEDEWGSLWPEGFRRIFERRFPSGDLEFTFDEADGYYRVCVAGFGGCVISADGLSIACDPSDPGEAMRERLVVAQALPLAALLRGFEPLHAGAVEVDGAVVAIVGERGAGKSTTILRMIAQGGRFFADDVLCLDLDAGEVRAHPGSSFISIRRDDRDSISLAETLGEVAAESDKAHLRLPAAPGPRPLARVYVLARGEEGESAAVLPASEQEDRGLLFENAFLPYLQTGERLVRQIDVLAAVSRSIGCHRVRVPAGDPDSGARAIVGHVRDR